MSNRIRIAIADDEEKICELLKTVLTDEGYVVDTYNYSLACLSALKSTPYDMLITDLKMPVMDGLDLAARARKTCPELVVLVVTGYASVESAVTALRAGFDDYIMKPLDIDEMKEVVARALEGRRLRRRNEHLVDTLKDANRDLIHAKKRLSTQITAAQDHLSKTTSSLKKRVHELSILNDISKVISSVLDLERLLDVYIELVRSKIGIRNCSILLMDTETNELVVCASDGENGTSLVGERTPIGLGIEGWVAENRIPVLIDDLAEDSRFKDKGSAKYDRGSFICAPLIAKGELLGVIDLNDKTSREKFTESDLRLLITITGQVAVAIDNARLYRILQENSYRTVQALATTLEAKDRYTHGHSARVTDYSVRVAQRMGMSAEEVEKLRYAAQLHDVGKIGVDEAILRKPTGLSDEERQAIQEHPVIGERIITPLDFLSEVRDIIRHHHEWWDGCGYPDGLKGDEISRLTQIMAVADAYDAMTSERPYRHARTGHDALNELKRCRGSQFAPDVTDVFVGAMTETSPAVG
ncbi:MAG TPA: HD domain-containing phosphohydrolase [Planctomycetota bacterium]|nr:HD domain-containing phosphohydrolase [Planctomycetota bacterium]